MEGDSNVLPHAFLSYLCFLGVPAVSDSSSDADSDSELRHLIHQLSSPQSRCSPGPVATVTPVSFEPHWHPAALRPPAMVHKQPEGGSIEFDRAFQVTMPVGAGLAFHCLVCLWGKAR